MAQAHVNICRSASNDTMGSILYENDSSNITSELNTINSNKRKVSLNLDGCHHVSVFQNEEARVVINIRKGTRSVNISKEVLTQLCGLQQVILQCCEFIQS